MHAIARLILLTGLSYLSVAIVWTGDAISGMPGNGGGDTKEHVYMFPYRLKTEPEIVKWTKWWTSSEIQHIDYDGETILVINIIHGSGYSTFFVLIYRFVDNEWSLCYKRKVDTLYEAFLDETRQWLVFIYQGVDSDPISRKKAEVFRLRIDSLKPLPIPEGYRWPPKLEDIDTPVESWGHP